MDTSNRADDMDLELNFPTDLGGKEIIIICLCVQGVLLCLLKSKTYMPSQRL